MTKRAILITAAIVMLLVFVVLPLVSLIAALIRAALTIAALIFVGTVVYLIVRNRDATT